MINIFAIILLLTVVIHFWLGIFDYNKKIKSINNSEWKNGWHYALEKIWLRLIVVSCLGLVGGLFMDTSIDNSRYDRVHNIGLISDRESLIVVASALLIVSTLFFVSNSIGQILTKKMIENTDSGKRCQYCAEIIKDEAVICKFCNSPQPRENDHVGESLKNK